MRPDGPRDSFAGPESGPESPFPIKLSGPVIKGFGRGSKELGIPTANIPPEGLSAYPDLKTGVYHGYVGLSLSHSPDTTSTSVQILPAVLSIGYNPFYKNTVRSVEIHVLHDFDHDFYGAALNLLMLGYIRPEYDYVSVDALIEDIRVDCDVARRSLEREAYVKLKQDPWLKDFTWMEKVDTKQIEREVLNKI